MKARIFAVVLAAVAATNVIVRAQLTPISWTCPMHPDILEDKKGKCSICGMDLEPVRLVTVWTCPVHSVVLEQGPGTCRICSRPLMATTRALSYSCAGKQTSQIDPGQCPDGSAAVAKYTVRPHGDHNPKHGGIFFMAPDNWHHIEGTYPAAGRFRVYVYDDFSKPLTMDKARRVRARAVTKEMLDPKTRTARELASAPLVLARNGAFFEARIEALALPAQMTAKISFGPDDKESRFDFTFPAFSKDQPAQSLSTSSAVPAKPINANEVGALLSELKAREAEIASFVKSRNFGALYLPALQAKDIALEIQSRAASAHGTEAPVRQIVVAAYQLDNYGDLGDGEKIADAYRTFTSAVASLESAVARR